MKKRLLIPLILIYLLSSMTGLAEPRGQIVAIDNTIFVAMVDSSIEDCIHIQEKENWCWAACMQAIFAYNGIVKSQEYIVTKLYGFPYNWTASGNDIMSKFDGWRNLSVRVIKTKNARTIINEIAAGHPLIIGYGEHAYLLTHIYCNRTSDMQLVPFKIVMIDPSTGKEEVFDWTKVYRKLNTIVSIH